MGRVLRDERNVNLREGWAQYCKRVDTVIRTGDRSLTSILFDFSYVNRRYFPWIQSPWTMWHRLTPIVTRHLRRARVLTLTERNVVKKGKVRSDFGEILRPTGKVSVKDQRVVSKFSRRTDLSRGSKFRDSGNWDLSQVWRMSDRRVLRVFGRDLSRKGRPSTSSGIECNRDLLPETHLEGH